MKVSEAIDRLKVGDTVWVKAKVNDFDEEAYDHRSIRSIEVELFQEEYWLHEEDEISLTEPQAEKVEVTEEQERLLKEREGETLFTLLSACKSEEEELFARARLFGYTVKPKRWVVRQGGSEVWYLQGFRNSLDGDIVKQWCSHEGCIKFTDKSKAEAVAVLVEGSVEEV